MAQSAEHDIANVEVTGSKPVADSLGTLSGENRGGHFVGSQSRTVAELNNVPEILSPRLTVGRSALDAVVGVRIPGG